jgi:hypothetical protein
VQRTGLAPRSLSRYGNTMSSPANLSPADALLRLWILAEITMAGLYGWQGWSIRDWPGDLPGPQPLRSVQISAFICLFAFVPAAVVAALRWRATRDRPLAGLAIFYGLASAASFAAWAQADTAGMMRALFWVDAAIALVGIPVAIRALRLR